MCADLYLRWTSMFHGRLACHKCVWQHGMSPIVFYSSYSDGRIWKGFGTPSLSLLGRYNVAFESRDLVCLVLMVTHDVEGFFPFFTGNDEGRSLPESSSYPPSICFADLPKESGDERVLSAVCSALLLTGT